MVYFTADDIVQIATPPGSAPVGALRISGENAFALLASLLAGDDADALRRPARFCRDVTVFLPLRGMREEKRRPVPCPARVFLMPAPASYTREHVAELHLPGCPALLRAAMDALVAAGARPAAAGEFTFRAFRNGRLGLGQAESVERVIAAASADEKRLALARLGDRAPGRIREYRESLLEMAAALEMALDFPEEEAGDDLAQRLSGLAREVAEAGAGLADAESAGAAGGGAPHLALVGLTNAGKSSLYNSLLAFSGSDAALVSSEASTTRDSLRRAVRWDGTELLLSDNPGFDPAVPDIGTAGGGRRAAARAMERLGGEDLAVWVVDASRALDGLDETLAEKLSSGAVIVLNKTDLPRRTGLDDVAALAERKAVPVRARAEVSASTGAGVPALRSLLARCAGGTAAAVWTRREGAELLSALESCRAAAAELAGAGRLELAADDVRRGVEAFSRALGEGYAEEALARIFSTFCIGK